MGDARPEGERSFWRPSEAPRGSGRPAQPPLGLSGEGGSDAYASNRHVRPQDQSGQTGFKLNFWSRDDSPVIRPVLQPALYASATVPARGRPRFLDGYGGAACEKITKLNRRSFRQWLGSALAVVAGGGVVFAILSQVKPPTDPRPARLKP